MPPSSSSQDVLVALLVPAARHVRVREFVHHTELRLSPQNRVDVHLFQHDASILDRAARDDLEITHLRLGVRASVGLDEAHDDVESPAAGLMRVRSMV